MSTETKIEWGSFAVLVKEILSGPLPIDREIEIYQNIETETMNSTMQVRISEERRNDETNMVGR